VGAGVAVAVVSEPKNCSCKPAGRLQARLITVNKKKAVASKGIILFFWGDIGQLPFSNNNLKWSGT
jgi:hypothetical protein